MNWILVLLVCAGPMAHGDSVALQSIPGFKAQAACEAAGKQLTPLVRSSTKEARFVCVQQQ